MSPFGGPLKVSSFLMDVQSGTIGSPGPGPCAVLSDSFQCGGS